LELLSTATVETLLSRVCFFVFQVRRDLAAAVRRAGGGAAAVETALQVSNPMTQLPIELQGSYRNPY
jgi:hypothetical protein